MTHSKINIATVLVLLVLVIVDWQMGITVFAYVTLATVYLLINLWGSVNISSQFFVTAKCYGDGKSKSIAITFDDGPVPEKTIQILNILNEHNVRATFFCIGKNIKARPAILTQIHRAGHVIGNHSYFHGFLFDLMTTRKMQMEISGTNNIIRDTIGLVPRFFRPPYGVTNPMVAWAVKKLNLVVVGWSIRSFDTTAKDRHKLLSRITTNMKAGDIILFHDRCGLTIEILPDLLRHIKRIGLQVEPLDKLIAESAYV
jgi:peptidoglycan-N-acetylglucosamine deacetylase